MPRSKKSRKCVSPKIFSGTANGAAPISAEIRWSGSCTYRVLPIDVSIAPPVAGGATRASGSGLYFQGGFDRRRKYRAPQQGRYAEPIFENVRHKDNNRVLPLHQQCEPKKISVRKTPKLQRFRGFVMPFFKMLFKRYHFPKTTFGEDLN